MKNENGCVGLSGFTLVDNAQLVGVWENATFA